MSAGERQDLFSTLSGATEKMDDKPQHSHAAAPPLWWDFLSLCHVAARSSSPSLPFRPLQTPGSPKGRSYDEDACSLRGRACPSQLRRAGPRLPQAGELPTAFDSFPFVPKTLSEDPTKKIKNALPGTCKSASWTDMEECNFKNTSDFYTLCV